MAGRYELDFGVPSLGNNTKTSYNGRSWTYDRLLNVWHLTDTHVLLFNGGDAITVQKDIDSNVNTSFDMDKVPLAKNLTSSED